VTDLQAQGFNTYWTLNRLRDSTTCDWHAGRGAAANGDIVCRHWLLVDIDCKTKPATDADLIAAKHTATIATTWLQQQGWPEPSLNICTGNGHHILYKCDLSNEPKITFGINNWLKVLAAECNNEHCVIDSSVGDPSRIARIPGSVNLKARRVATVHDSHSNAAFVTTTMLDEYTAGCVERRSQTSTNGGGLDLQQWLLDVNAPLKHPNPKILEDGGRLWEFTFDPVSGRTDDTSAYVIQHPDGGLAAGSRHQSPESQWGWSELRQSLEPPVSIDLSGIQVDSAAPQPQVNATIQPVKMPQPLPSLLPDVERFQAELLPAHLSELCHNIAGRLSTPVEFAACCVISALGASLGTRLAVRPKQNDTWFEYCNLWTAMVAPPGVGKSPMMQEAMQPVITIDEQLRQESAETSAKTQAYNAVIEQQIEGLKKSLAAAIRREEVIDRKAHADAMSDLQRQLRPIEQRRLYVTDFTVEAVQSLLEHNPNGLLVMCDELSGLLKQMSLKEFARLREFILMTWGGKAPLSQIRISRDDVNLNTACLTIIGAVTPSVLSNTVQQTEDQGGDGLLQRFLLLTWPELPKFIDSDQPPESALMEQYSRLITRLNSDAVLAAATGAVGTVPVVQFDPEATNLLQTWRTVDLEPLKRDCAVPQAFRSHVNKHLKLVPAMALLLHLADGRRGQISSDTVDRSLRWATLLRTHLNRVYGCGMASDRAGAYLLAQKLMSRKIESPFSERDVYRQGWHGLDRKAVQPACLLLCDLHWLTVQQTSGLSHRTHNFSVNPAIFESDFISKHVSRPSNTTTNTAMLENM